VYKRQNDHEDDLQANHRFPPQRRHLSHGLQQQPHSQDGERQGQGISPQANRLSQQVGPGIYEGAPCHLDQTEERQHGAHQEQDSQHFLLARPKRVAKARQQGHKLLAERLLSFRTCRCLPPRP
jgi:hypothetical protein